MFLRALFPALFLLGALFTLPNCNKSESPGPRDTIYIRDTVIVRDTVLVPIPPDPPTLFDSVVLGAQLSDSGSFFSPATGRVYRNRDSALLAAHKVDFSFATLGVAEQPTLVSLHERRNKGLNRVLGVNRTTRFQAANLSRASFDTVRNGFLSRVPLSGTTTIPLQEDKSYYFVNQEGKKGILFVRHLAEPASARSTVLFDVKYQR